MEISEQLARQLLESIENGFINETTISKFRYWHLDAVMNMTKYMEHGRETFWEIKSYLEQMNIERLRKQEKIIVGFITSSSQDWIGDELYWLLEKSEKFEPYIFVMATYLNGRGNPLKRDYCETVSFFQKRGLRVKQTFDVETEHLYTWDEIGMKPQLCIWLTPWADGFKEHFHLLYYSLDTIHAYIPYGFMIAGSEDGRFIEAQYNQLIHNIAWKIFEENKIAVELAGRYSFVGNRNTVYLGYPKMDSFYGERENCTIWDQLKEKVGNPNAKCVIYAPHHTLDKDKEPVCFSTFAQNGKKMLEFARKYHKDTVWVFKPHPLLRTKLIRNGILKDESEWKSYIKQWEDLGNAAYVNDGMYQDMMCKSDAMILDSISFLAEYMYTSHPMLFLQRKEQRFNEFGKLVVEQLYQAEGNDFAAIDEFLQKVVLKGKDEQLEKRKKFFLENLDYKNMNYKNANAAQSIYCEIENTFGRMTE